MSKQNNLTDFLTDVADAIRQKKGTQAPINPQDFSSEIASIPTGGNNPLQDMLDRSSNTNATNLFYVYSYNNAQTIFSLLTYENLIALDFSNKHYTDTSYMFSGCSSLTTVPLFDLSKVKTTSFMFHDCSSLTTVPLFDLSKATSTSNMFFHCTSLTTVPQFDLSKVTTANGMFNTCRSLTTVPLFDLSSATNTSSMFYDCRNLTSVPFFNLSSSTDTSSMFSDCPSLTTLDFSNIKTIGPWFAAYSSSLSTLIIRNQTTLATLGSWNAFYNTPIYRGTGYIYVPDDLVDNYKQATNWSTYAAQIKGLSELPQGE